MTSVSSQVSSNIAGSIVVGENQFVVHTRYGALVSKAAQPQVKLRKVAPQPPQAPVGFIGRAAELSRLETWISANEVVLLHAVDGLGKTALMRQVASTPAARAMPNGIIMLEAVGFEGQALGADDVFQRMFSALFESDPLLKVDSATARNYLAYTKPLVLLDEVPLPPMLQRALPDLIPQGAFLFSADLPMGGDFQRLSLGPLPREAAAHLLANRAGIEPEDGKWPVLKFICGLLEDISLAVCLAGNVMRATGMTPEAMLAALGEIKVGGLDPFAMALDRVYTLVFNRLSDLERKMLAVAALTPGVSLAPEWLAWVMDDEEITAALDRLKSLELLYLDQARLRLPPGFRQVARRLAVLREEFVMGRLLEYLFAGPQGAGEFDFIEAELGNFLGALTWAARAERPGDVIALGQRLDAYVTLHGLWDVWAQMLGLVMDAAVHTGDRAVEAWVLHQMGTRLIGLENVSQAIEYLQHALKLRRRLNDLEAAAYTEHNLSQILPPMPPLPPPPLQPRRRLRWWGQVLLVLAIIGTLVGMMFWLSTVRPRPFVRGAEAPAQSTPSQSGLTTPGLAQAE